MNQNLEQTEDLLYKNPYFFVITRPNQMLHREEHLVLGNYILIHSPKVIYAEKKIYDSFCTPRFQKALCLLGGGGGGGVSCREEHLCLETKKKILFFLLFRKSPVCIRHELTVLDDPSSIG